jgi:hypothetical protein
VQTADFNHIAHLFFHFSLQRSFFVI